MYVIIFEVDIVAEQKQTYIGHNLFVFMIIHCPNFLLLPILHRFPGILVNQLPGFVLKNSFGMILEVLLTKQKKTMAWPEWKPERQVMFCYNKTS